MVRFVIVRHGFSVTNLEKRYTGQNDVPLTETGHAQARECARYIAANYTVDAIHSSDLSRAYDTMLPLSQLLNIPIIKEPSLREVDVGLWQGILVEDMRREHPEKLAAYYADRLNFVFDGGESHAMAGKRAYELLVEIAQKNDGKTIAVGSHGGVIKTIITNLLGTDEVPLMPNASITELLYQNGRLKIEKMPQYGHLSEITY